MKPFSTIAIPHRDILEGKPTMDVFAALAPFWRWKNSFFNYYQRVCGTLRLLKYAYLPQE